MFANCQKLLAKNSPKTSFVDNQLLYLHPLISLEDPALSYFDLFGVQMPATAHLGEMKKLCTTQRSWSKCQG